MKLESPIAEDLGLRLPQRTLTFTLKFLFRDVLVLPWGFRMRRVAYMSELVFILLLPVLEVVESE